MLIVPSPVALLPGRGDPPDCRRALLVRHPEVRTMTVGQTIITLVTNPESAPALTRLAAAIARPAGGIVVPLTVVPRSAGTAERDAAERLILASERLAQGRGVPSRGLLAIDDAVDEAVLEVTEERDATLVVMGWQGQSTHRNVFGEIIDSVVGRSRVPLLVSRLTGSREPWRRVLLTVSSESLAGRVDTSLRLASVVADRLRRDTGSMEILRSGDSTSPLPAELTGTFAPVHHDPRRHDLAVAAAARHDDLIVLPVPPTSGGLRTATHLAWAAPDSSILVVVPAARTQAERLAAAVAGAGAVPLRLPSDDNALREHLITVTARLPQGRAVDPHRVAEALAAVGQVSEAGLWTEEARECAELTIRILASDQNAALGTVMTSLHGLAGFDGAEFRYDLDAGLPVANGV
jgi:nucleotide-binding universal stress UspA family protein